MTMWGEINADLCNILEMLRATTVKMLEKIGEVVYIHGVEENYIDNPNQVQEV